MGYKNVIVGFAVLALVAAGGWWARARTSMPASPDTAAPSPQADDDALPDVTLANGSVSSGDVRITLSLTPNPPVALAKTRVRVRAESGGSAVALEGSTISFEMTMPMGDHRYSLVAGQDGWQEAEVILPRCMSGKRRWFATVEGAVAGRPRTARFRLDLAPPK
jgi:hypothetical protein